MLILIVLIVKTIKLRMAFERGGDLTVFTAILCSVCMHVKRSQGH